MKSIVHSSLAARKMGQLELEKKHVGDAAVKKLRQMGIDINPQFVRDQVAGLYQNQGRSVALDSAFTPSVTAQSVPTPLQFLQYWLPGFVKVVTAARKIDKLIGIQTVGSWEDQEIVQGVVESTGFAAEYGDYTNVPMANWNVNFERRTVVRGELGIQVGSLEEARAATMRVSAAEEKRQSAGISLEIFRNSVGFYGWNNGANRTFGFLNDPNLPAWTTVPAGSGTGNKTTWDAKTFLEITADIRLAIVTLRTQSQDLVDPESVEMCLALPTSKVDYLSVVSDFGISVRDWVSQTYPKVRIESAPELIGANGSADGFVLFCDDIDSSIDGSSDGGQTFVQLVPQKFMTLGVERRVKTYVEDFGNATAGVLLKRPWAVVRFSGI